MRMRGLVAGLSMLAIVPLAGCGGSGGSSSSTESPPSAAGSSGQGGSSASRAKSTGGPSGSGASEAPTSSKPARLASGTIATVAGTPITSSAYTSQLHLLAYGPVKALIANPSDYAACISAEKKREEQTRKLIQGEEEKYAKRLNGRKGSSVFPQNRRQVTSAQLKQQCETLYKNVKQQAETALIYRVRTEAQAKELGVSVSESEIQTQLKAREASEKTAAKARSSLIAAEVPHYAGADLREMVKSNLLEGKVSMKVREKFAKPGSLSQETLEKYFNEHKQLYATPEQRQLDILYAKSEAQAQKAKREISSGKSFASVSASLSNGKFQASTTETYGCQQQGAQSIGIQAAVCSAKQGALSGPVKAFSTEYVVFRVNKITPAVSPSFSVAKERIKELLSSQGEEQGSIKYNEEINTKYKDRTECAAGYIVPLCKEYVPPKPIVPTAGGRVH